MEREHREGGVGPQHADGTGRGFPSCYYAVYDPWLYYYQDGRPSTEGHGMSVPFFHWGKGNILLPRWLFWPLFCDLSLLSGPLDISFNIFKNTELEGKIGRRGWEIWVSWATYWQELQENVTSNGDRALLLAPRCPKLISFENSISVFSLQK